MFQDVKQDVEQMISRLDVYLIIFPRQHIYCLSPDNEFVTIVNYTIQLHVDLNVFPNIWAVLSILLESQHGNALYTQTIQQCYKQCYKDRTKDYMWELEMASGEIQ